MNENIDLTKILDGCPAGTEFYHSEYGRVYFLYINTNYVYSIRFTTFVFSKASQEFHNTVGRISPGVLLEN